MKLIPLSQGLFTMVDDEDYGFLNHWKWTAEKDGDTYYVQRKEYALGEQKTIRMHRVIMGTFDKVQVDHRDHNGLNNQRSNLRNCSIQQNQMNKKSRGNCKSLGVYYDVKLNRFFANITFNRKRYKLGRYKTEEAAARAYDAKAKDFFGEFANLNFK